MSEVMLLVLAPLAGMLLGAMYFGGLWWTVRKGLASPRPAQWFIFSLLLRLGLALIGFYFVAGDDWKKMLACLLGFIVARIIVIRLTEMPMVNDAGAKEASHAP